MSYFKQALYAIGVFVLLYSLILGYQRSRTTKPYRNKSDTIRLATTTSIQTSGLLDFLLPDAERSVKLKFEVIAVGSGKAFKLAEAGDVDAIIVHAPQAESSFMESGFGVDRYQFMRSDFVIVGPASDPAHAGGSSAVRAMCNIAGHQFVSRGDESGTHLKEQELWKIAGITPRGRWYFSVGQGMAETLIIANEKQSYCLTDRATYLSMKNWVNLKVLCEGDSHLLNYYSVIVVNPRVHQHINYRGAKRFAEYLTSPRGQRKIATFRIHGSQPFFPNINSSVEKTNHAIPYK